MGGVNCEHIHSHSERNKTFKKLEFLPLLFSVFFSLVKQNPSTVVEHDPFSHVKFLIHFLQFLAHCDPVISGGLEFFLEKMRGDPPKIWP